MKTLLAGISIVCGLSIAVVGAQQADKPAKDAKDEPLTLTGCVSPKPGTSGQYTFEEVEGIGKYRLNGKDIKKFAGQRVELVVGSPARGLAIRGGLWPSPNVAARGGGVDAAQESIARQPGGGGGPAGENLPEIRVTRLKVVDGACQ